MDDKNKIELKINKKGSLVRNRGCIQTPTAPKKTQQSSKLTQQHSILQKKLEIKAYATVCSKPAYVREHSRENYVYTQL